MAQHDDESVSSTENEVEEGKMLIFAWNFDAVKAFYLQARVQVEQGVPLPPGISRAFILSILDLIITGTDAAGFATRNAADLLSAVIVAVDFARCEWVRTTRQVRIEGQQIGVPVATLYIHGKETLRSLRARIDVGRLTLMAARCASHPCDGTIARM